MPKIDLHTHSVASPDGSITYHQYKKILEAGTLDLIAVTDHNRIDFALRLQQEFGQEKIIVGEEISTLAGDIIGLYLHELVPAGLPLAEAIQAIRKQGGIVYIPHPFETVRKGLQEQDLNAILAEIDIIETVNGRALFQNRKLAAQAWAQQHRKPMAAASDAHRSSGLGKTYTEISEIPRKETIVQLLATGQPHYQRPSIGDVTAPKLNRFRKGISKWTR